MMRTHRAALFLLALSMFLPITVQFIGEESVFAFYVERMHFTKNFLHEFYRPPLFLWFALALREIFPNLPPEFPIRIVSIFSSLLSAAVSFAFAYKEFDRERAPWIAAVVFLSTFEIQFWYGWLGYADAMFHFFCFASMAFGWIGMHTRQFRWLWAGAVAATLGFLTKSFVAYYFFFLSVFLSGIAFRTSRIFLKPRGCGVFLFCLVSLVGWSLIQDGHGSSAAQLVRDVAIRFQQVDALDYLLHAVKILVEFFLRSAPFSFIVFWVVWRQRKLLKDMYLRHMAMVLALGILPFLLASKSGMRHVVPLYGWASLLISYTLWRGFPRLYGKPLNGIVAAVVALKVIYSFVGLPVLKDGEDRSFRRIAKDIAQITRCRPLFLADDSFVGFSVAVYYHKLCKLESPPVRVGGADTVRGFVFSYRPHAGMRQIKHYSIFGGIRYLEAPDADVQRPKRSAP